MSDFPIPEYKVLLQLPAIIHSPTNMAPQSTAHCQEEIAALKVPLARMARW